MEHGAIEPMKNEGSHEAEKEIPNQLVVHIRPTATEYTAAAGIDDEVRAAVIAKEKRVRSLKDGEREIAVGPVLPDDLGGLRDRRSSGKR
jgi:hypothetical protein